MYIINNHSHLSRWFYQWIWNHKVHSTANHLNKLYSQPPVEFVLLVCSSLYISISIIHTGPDSSINKSEIITRCISLSIIHTGADDSINEYEIITRCISILIIYTGADSSINKSEIITRCISLSIIHTGADDSINESDIITRYI